MGQHFINISPDNKLPPQKGRLLISEPFLADPYFRRTVVLLCEHNEEGSFGFILNKFIDVGVNELIEDLPQLGSRVSMGGPVQSGNLYYIHTLGQKIEGSVEIVKGVYMGGSFDMLKILLKSGTIKKGMIRFFVGYAGWGHDQLAEEMKERSWLVTPADPKALMDSKKDDLWRQTLLDMGEEYAMLANFPEDPSLN